MCVWEGADRSQRVTEMTVTVGIKPDSRAVTMLMKYNDNQECTSCGRSVMFTQGTSNIWVLANVYVDCDHSEKECARCLGYGRRWDRLEHWHEVCYEGEGKPYGETEFRKTKVVTKREQ